MLPALAIDFALGVHIFKLTFAHLLGGGGLANVLPSCDSIRALDVVYLILVNDLLWDELYQSCVLLLSIGKYSIGDFLANHLATLFVANLLTAKVLMGECEVVLEQLGLLINEIGHSLLGIIIFEYLLDEAGERRGQI